MMTIHITGDAYRALFYIPPGSVKRHDSRALARIMPVGVEYLYSAVKVILIGAPGQGKCTRDNWSRQAARVPLAICKVDSYGTVALNRESLKQVPLLRVDTARLQELDIQGFEVTKPEISGSDSPPERPDVLVHWIGELANERLAPNVAMPCRIHIQTGMSRGWDPSSPADAATTSPGTLAAPDVARVVVLNIGEISSSLRIRRSQSYEAIAVDLLRHIRGDGTVPKYNEALLKHFSMAPSGRVFDIVVVRINRGAVFVFAMGNAVEKPEAGPPRNCESAWLLCHKDECAPLSDSELSSMVGYSGFITAHLAASLSTSPPSSTLQDVIERVLDGVRRGLLWQHNCHECGIFTMLFPENEGADDSEMASGYTSLCAHIANNVRSLEPRRSIVTVPIQIRRAVAHRTQWFMARSTTAWKDESISAGIAGLDGYSDKDLRDDFIRIALEWLSDGLNPKDSQIPIVRIGEAELTDRREVEDFLAVNQSLSVYARSAESKPLNIAVFGAPGAGKSFAVKQIVQHLGGAKRVKHPGESKFKESFLTFNLGQFKSLEDLPSALHLVRNECLSGDIPIVFFDEFDSTMNGQPFGWLKYFLAPMQDGEFYDSGQNYKIGRAVFVFAGGVNRSFEELNGRVRNPSFCEAKGPDFISRLKGHLNVQGINRPEEDSDQSRYILRRGILLRGFVRKRLGIPADQDAPLLHSSVASALLEVERFRHGVRSLEAIIKMCSSRAGHPIGPSDLPSMDQLEMHVDAAKLLRHLEEATKN